MGLTAHQHKKAIKEHVYYACQKLTHSVKMKEVGFVIKETVDKFSIRKDVHSVAIQKSNFPRHFHTLVKTRP